MAQVMIFARSGRLIGYDSFTVFQKKEVMVTRGRWLPGGRIWEPLIYKNVYNAEEKNFKRRDSNEFYEIS